MFIFVAKRFQNPISNDAYLAMKTVKIVHISHD